MQVPFQKLGTEVVDWSLARELAPGVSHIKPGAIGLVQQCRSVDCPEW
jgi:hypothetical protein